MVLMWHSTVCTVEAYISISISQDIEIEIDIHAKSSTYDQVYNIYLGGLMHVFPIFLFQRAPKR